MKADRPGHGKNQIPRALCRPFPTPISRPLPSPYLERPLGFPKNSHLSDCKPLIRYRPFVMKADTHPKYVDAEIRCACGNVIKTRSTRQTILIGICNVCHPFYTGQQKFVDTAGRVDKFQQRMAKTQAAQAVQAANVATRKKRK
jgi:large subunit ribosomal protein L31